MGCQFRFISSKVNPWFAQVAAELFSKQKWQQICIGFKYWNSRIVACYENHRFTYWLWLRSNMSPSRWNFWPWILRAFGLLNCILHVAQNDLLWPEMWLIHVDTLCELKSGHDGHVKRPLSSECSLKCPLYASHVSITLNCPPHCGSGHSILTFLSRWSELWRNIVDVHLLFPNPEWAPKRHTSQLRMRLNPLSWEWESKIWALNSL